MTSPYKQFIFEDYTFDASSGTLNLHYSYDHALFFTETYYFDFPFAAYDPSLLDQACQSLFFMGGVSYYKMYLAREIVIKRGALDAQMADFFSQTYQSGLGEFFYVNKLDPHTTIDFPTNQKTLEAKNSRKGEGVLVAIGGGKDSLVSVEMLRGQTDNLATWSLNHRSQLTPLVERIGLPHYWVERTWDSKISELNKQGALNGHVPISAIFACVGTIAALLTGRRDVAMSNEQSANEPTLHYQGLAINHQFSKSQAFERAYQHYLSHTLGDAVRYYSFLRPLSEVHIAELFARHGFNTYKGVFSSCNRAFVQGSDHLFWDGTCPKCAFIFMALAPFVERAQLEELFHGKNLLLDPALEPTYRQLLGIESNKPLDCVGDVKESRAAMRLAERIYPELATLYHFKLPTAYNYRQLSSHDMPSDIYPRFTAALGRLEPSAAQHE